LHFYGKSEDKTQGGGKKGTGGRENSTKRPGSHREVAKPGAPGRVERDCVVSWEKKEKNDKGEKTEPKKHCSILPYSCAKGRKEVRTQGVKRESEWGVEDDPVVIF